MFARVFTLTAQQQEKLARWLVPGTKLRVFYNEGNPSNATIEIRGFIDDRIIYRQWSKRHRCWDYYVGIRYKFELMLAHGNITLTRQGKE